MAKRKYEEVTPELKERIENKISWEGLEYYLEDGGYAQEDFEGTHLEPLLEAYTEARQALVAALEALDIDV